MTEIYIFDIAKKPIDLFLENGVFAYLKADLNC